uniref:Putative cytochrome P450 n=1 Tax=Eschscholzia californica subsp. californica TaxID=222997 RepID=A0A2Z6BXX9_ESCCA|nr:putative cytochrome P450 [Eschscholzia californica subsp. californica]
MESEFSQHHLSKTSIVVLISSFLIASALLLFFKLFSWRSKRSSKSSNRDNLKQPPEPAGAWPIVGHLPHLMAGGRDLPHVTLAAMADKYGPAFIVRMGTYKALIVSSWEIEKECYTTNDRAFASRPRLIALEHLGYNHSLFGFAPYGPYWREMRKIITQELLSNSRLDLFKHVWDSEINSSIKKLYEIWEKSSSSGDGGGAQPVLVEMKHWFADLTLNIIVKLVAGKPGLYRVDKYTSSTISNIAIEDKVAEAARRYHKQFRDFFRLVGQFILGDALPFLRWLDLGGYEKEMKRTRKELGVLMDEWLEAHKIKRLTPMENEGDKGREHKDFMDVMLSVLDNNNTELSKYFDADTINKSTCLGMIAGGSDTPMVILVWALTLLVNNPHLLKKAQDELDIHVGRERQVQESDIKNLLYLQAVVKETLRLYSGPITGLREADEDCVVAGYHIPAGTRLIVNTWKIHRDPRVWSDPMEFQPERFLTTHKDMDVKGKNFELLPFATGRRSCPAMSLALQIVHLSLVRTIHAFDFKLPTANWYALGYDRQFRTN